MMLQGLNATAGDSHRQRLWIPLLIAFVAVCGFVLPLTYPGRAASEPMPVAALPLSAALQPLSAEVAPAPLTSAANLVVSQSGPQRVFAGDTISYTVVVMNQGSSPANDVVLTDTWTTNIYQNIADFWPYGMLATFQDYQVDPPGAVTSFTHQVNDALYRGEATWWLNPIVGGDSVEIVFTVTVPITTQPSLASYIAEPFPSTRRQLGPSTAENSIFASIGTEIFPAEVSTAQIVAPLLQLTQTATGEGCELNQGRVGRLLTYTIEIENVFEESRLLRPDGWPAIDLVVTEILPEEVQSGFITAAASEPGVTWTYSEAVGTLTWRFAPTFVLTRGEKTYVTYTVRVPADLQYNPTKYLMTRSGSSTGDLRARAAYMPFREAALRFDHRVTLISPFDKTVITQSPPPGENSTYANRPVTYTLTYYSPISETALTTLEDGLPSTFIFSNTVSGDLPTPAVSNEGSRLLWENVEVPGYGIIYTTFVVTVSEQTLVRPGGTACRYLDHANAITATSSAFPVGSYIGHNNNRIGLVRVEPQLKVSKSVLPSSQFPGQNVTYKITLQNVGDTLIPAPIVVTDTLPEGFTFVGMDSAPPPGDPTVNGNVLVWDNVPGLAAGATLVFSFVAEVDGLPLSEVENGVIADSTATSYCEIWSAKVKVLSPFLMDKIPESWTHETVVVGYNAYPLVRQGDPVTYTASILNVSPRSTYTLTEFVDILDSAAVTNKDRTGLVNSLDPQSLEYSYPLPTPFTLYPEAATSWEHTFTATMQGFGTTMAWCDDKEQIRNAKVEQEENYVQFIMEDTVAFNADELAQIYVLPHVSLYQQAYPNPVAIGEIVTVVLTLRDNRTNPITPVTGIHLQWNLPSNAGFTLLDTDPMTSSSNAASAFWDNVDLPLGGERVFLIHMRAPWYREPGWKRNYYSTAQVNSLDDASICIPKSTRFIESNSGTVGPDYELGLPGPIPDYSDQLFVYLVVNQGIEIDKVADPKEIGPYGAVEYEVIVKNLTGAPVPSIVITDILPYVGVNSWQYLETVDGVEPHGEDPLYWNIGTIEALSQLRVVIKTRAISAVGLALNQVLGTGPINIGYHKDYTTHAGVMVVSGIGFYKVVDPESIFAGEATTYTIRLYNGASYDIDPVIITDTLPFGFSFDGMVTPPDLLPEINGQQLVWTLPAKVNKSGGTFDIVFRARAATEEEGMFTGKYYNDIIASAKRADTGDPVEMPPTGPTAPVYVDGLPTVQVHKTASPQTVVQGHDVIYEIALYNEAETARTLQITDTLPTNFTLAELIDPTEATTSYAGSQQQIIWHDIPIGGQSWVTLTFRAHVDDEAPPGRYGNVVQVQINAFALPPSQPMANVWVVQLPRTDAKVSKTDGSLVAEKGATIDYTIVYTNASPDELAFETIILTETISPPPPYVSVVGTDWTDLGEGRFRREIAGPLNPGTSGTVQFSVQLENDIPADYQWLHNQVEIDYTTEEPTIESTPADNVAEDWNLISGGESIVAVKQASYADETLLAGQELTYTITLFNATVQAESVRVTDTLPLSFTLSAAVSPPIEMTQMVNDQQQVVWAGVAIPAQGFATIVFRARVNPMAEAATACNVIQVQRGDGTVLPPTDPQACVEVTPLARVDAQVNKTDGEDWAEPGDVLLYTIQYGNAATSQVPLATIVLTETVSPPEVIDSILTSGWTPLGNGQYRITPTGLQPGETATELFAVRLKDTIPPTMTAVYNQVEIGYTTTEPAVELNNFDNVGTDVTVLRLNPDDVIVSKSVAAPTQPAYPEDVVTYTITILNDTLNAYTLRVTDTLPIHFTFESAVDPISGYTTQWDGNRQLVIWDTSVAPQTTLSLIFRAQIASTVTTNRYCNDVQVQRGPVVQAPITGLACLDVLSSLKVVDAQVSKSDGRTSTMPGEVLTYTITYANAGTSALSFDTVILTETITPIEYLTVLSLDWTSLGGGRYTREIAEPLTPGVAREVLFVVELDTSIPDTITAITNTVEIDYTTPELSDEINLTNNTSTDVTLVGSTIIIVPGGKIYLPLILRNH
ncbi:MAG: hypothetical protein ACP5J4_13240 [Anaerolineae bacterium]